MMNKAFRSRRAWCGLLLAAVTLACADGTGPGGPAVASVEISGVPNELYLNKSVQLAVVLKDASGNTLSGRKVSWTSSDTTVATVSSGGMVTGRKAGDAVIVATSEQHSATALVRVRLETVASVQISGAPTAPIAAGTTVQLQATTYNSAGEVLTNRPVAWHSDVPARATVSATGLVHAVSGGDVTIRVTSEGKSASATLKVYDPVATVEVIPGSAGLYPTQVLDLSATARSAAGAPLTGRPVAWSTSDPGKATVDATGKVTAVAAGDVSITATVEGKTASAAIKVLARPVANWAGAVEWSTFQGNARHTGHVPVTADPVVFRELWVRSPFGAVQLNPVTEGGGRVFVSEVTYFGSQRMVALDARTGATRWTHDFGAIHSVHPPAYGNGRVFVTTGGHGDSYLYGFDAASGTVAFRTRYGNQWSRWYAPVVVGGTVFMAGGYYGGMYAFSADDGEEKWFAQTAQYDEWTPAVANGRVYAHTGTQLAVHDAATGNKVDSIADPNHNWHGWSMGGAPVLGGRDNVLATQGGRLVSFDLPGRSVGWERTGSFTGPPVVVDGVIYVINNNQVEARRESDGGLLWPWIPPQGQAARGTMVVTDNLLFVSTATHTYALDLSARLQTWSYPASGHLTLGRDGILLIAGQNGSLAAIDLK